MSEKTEQDTVQYGAAIDLFQRLVFFKDVIDKGIEDARDRNLDSTELALIKIRDEFNALYNAYEEDTRDIRSQKESQIKSDNLAILNQAATKFWSNADPKDNATHPLNSTVAAWLVERKFTPTLADKGATIIRPAWATTGRKADK